jgi:hypothetical protein
MIFIPSFMKICHVNSNVIREENRGTRYPKFIFTYKIRQNAKMVPYKGNLDQWVINVFSRT